MADAKRGRPAAKPFDPFAAAPESYSPYEFYTRATNDNDHSTNIQTHFPPEIASHISSIVQSGDFGSYSSSQALIRDAVIHRLHFLHTETGNFEGLRIVGIERAAARAEMRRQMKEKQQAYYQALASELEGARDDRDWEEVLRICDQTGIDIDELDVTHRRRASMLINKARTMAEEKLAREGGDDGDGWT